MGRPRTTGSDEPHGNSQRPRKGDGGRSAHRRLLLTCGSSARAQDPPPDRCPAPVARPPPRNRPGRGARFACLPWTICALAGLLQTGAPAPSRRRARRSRRSAAGARLRHRLLGIRQCPPLRLGASAPSIAACATRERAVLIRGAERELAAPDLWRDDESPLFLNSEEPRQLEDPDSAATRKLRRSRGGEAEPLLAAPARYDRPAPRRAPRSSSASTRPAGVVSPKSTSAVFSPQERIRPLANERT
jgi:hypothetical protein